MDEAQWFRENKERLAYNLRHAVEVFLNHPSGNTLERIARVARDYYVAFQPVADQQHAEEQDRLRKELGIKRGTDNGAC